MQGNDLGVYFSQDGGENWELFSEGLPSAVLVMHLSISHSNRKLRVATYGNGVYETDMVPPPVDVGINNNIEKKSLAILGQNYPNPFKNQTIIPVQLPENYTMKSLKVYDNSGRMIEIISDKNRAAGSSDNFTISTQDWIPGVYYYTLEYKTQKGKIMTETKVMVK